MNHVSRTDLSGSVAPCGISDYRLRLNDAANVFKWRRRTNVCVVVFVESAELPCVYDALVKNNTSDRETVEIYACVVAYKSFWLNYDKINGTLT